MDPGRKHAQLLQMLHDNIGTDDLESLKAHASCLRPGIGRGVAAGIHTAHQFFSKLEQLGHLAAGKYDVLRDMCSDSNLYLLVDIIGEAERQMHGVTSSEKNFNDARPDPLEPVEPVGGLDVHATVPRSFPGAEYPAENSRCLLAIFNNFTVERKGTVHDELQVINFFQRSLGYTMRGAYRDLSRALFRSRLEEVQGELNRTPYDQLVVVIMSHGSKEGIMTCKEDGKTQETEGNIPVHLPVEAIVEYFKCTNVPNLTGKPKLFFIQACRGDKTQPSHVFSDTEPTTPPHAPPLQTTPNDSDILICYSTTDEYVSWRGLDGSWFIKSLVDTFSTYHQVAHVLDMMTQVNDCVAKMEEKASRSDAQGLTVTEIWKQMPCQLSTLRRAVRLRACQR